MGRPVPPPVGDELISWRAGAGWRGAKCPEKALALIALSVERGRSPSVRSSKPQVARARIHFFVIFVPLWWKIADVTKDTVLVRGVRSDRIATGRGSAILHHDTKITKRGLADKHCR